MNAVELLVEQHRDVESLFDRFDEVDEAEQAEIAKQVILHLRVHTTIEEEIFYPAVREAISDVEDEILEDLEEHHAVEMLLDELEDLEPSHERFAAKFEVISELVEHHVEEEEEDLFPEVEDAVDDDTLADLAVRMQDLADELRPEFEADVRTKEQLYARATELGVGGRSRMSKRQLARAVQAQS